MTFTAPFSYMHVTIACLAKWTKMREGERNVPPGYLFHFVLHSMLHNFSMHSNTSSTLASCASILQMEHSLELFSHLLSVTLMTCVTSYLFYGSLDSQVSAFKGPACPFQFYLWAPFYNRDLNLNLYSLTKEGLLAIFFIFT